jgi:16S rRNA processing protein RimM
MPAMADPDRLVLVARVSGAFGVRGELRLASFTEEPMTLVRLKALRRADGSAGLTLSSGRPHKGGLVARAAEVADKDQADALRGLELYAPRSALPAPAEDEFYLTDLIGLEAVDPDGAPVGRIRAVPNFGAGDLLEIEPAGGGQSWLVAFTAENVPQVDVAGGRIVVIRPAEVG